MKGFITQGRVLKLIGFDDHVPVFSFTDLAEDG